MTTEDSGRASDRASSVGNNSKAFYDIIGIAITHIRRGGGVAALDAFVESLNKKLAEEKDPGYASRLKHGNAYVASLIHAVKEMSADASSVTSPPPSNGNGHARPTDTNGSAVPAPASVTHGPSSASFPMAGNVIPIQPAPKARNEAAARLSNWGMMQELLNNMKEAKPMHEDMIPYPAIDHLVEKNSEGDPVVRLCSRDGIVNGKTVVVNCKYDGEVCGKKHPDICLGPGGKPCFDQIEVKIGGRVEKCIAKIFKCKEGSPIKYWYQVDGRDKEYWYGKIYAGKVVEIDKKEYDELERFAKRVRASE